jgi:amidohydrolase
METKQALKEAAARIVDEQGDRIAGIGDRIMTHPELGFKEFKTAELVARTMEEIGLTPRTGLALTGVKAVLEGARPGPTVALLGELDAVVVAGHPAAEPGTDAAHACGHNAQVAALLGAMMGLVKSGATRDLAGRVVFFAVPAEEYVDIEYRASLLAEGKLGYLGGKPELVRLGHFDDVDLAVMFHLHARPEDKTVLFPESHNGCLVKMIKYIGRAAHAGGAPHLGINALNAAHLALAGIHAQRETFKDEDSIRIHPIITRGGELVNVVPSLVKLETFVRGKTVEAIVEANQGLDRALRAGAMAVGAQVEIRTLPGYLPVLAQPDLEKVFKTNCEALFGSRQCAATGHQAGSTDLGDLSHLMPAIHPYFVGAQGNHHSVDWCLREPEKAYLNPAKALAATVIDLLWDRAETAKEILENFKPAMTKAEYLAFQDRMYRTELYNGQNNTSREE